MENNEPLNVFCTKCNCIVRSSIVSSYQTEEYVIGNQVIFDESELKKEYFEYIFSKCPRCNSPFITKDRYFISLDWSGKTDSEVIFPMKDGFSGEKLPQNIMNAYESASQSFSAGLYEPCVIMCRKCIEAICYAKHIQKGNLKEKLNELKQNNIIDGKLHAWADSLRLIGNDAAHDFEVIISKEDAIDSIEFTKAILLYVFVLTMKYDNFKKRYDQKEGKK